MQVSIIDWDGASVPEGLFRLPPGRYVVESVEALTELTPEEEDGLMEALDSLDRGEGIPYEEVMSRLRSSLPTS